MSPAEQREMADRSKQGTVKSDPTIVGKRKNTDQITIWIRFITNLDYIRFTPRSREISSPVGERNVTGAVHHVRACFVCVKSCEV